LNIPLPTNILNARNYFKSNKEEQDKEDDKSISLGMPMQPKKTIKKNKWRKNGVAIDIQLPLMVTHKLI
jgi:hypothetical protein